VTGASSGIGRASALFYAREGAKVVVSDVNEESGEKTVRLIQEAHGEAVFVKTDVANPADCETLVKRTVEKYGRLDFACNNAGIGGEQNLTADYTIEGWQRDCHQSIRSHCMKFEIIEMLKAGGAS
jgi:NAD(P)-dependent dehydrogenase (short-subunit alcohol dehydrogenase family)